mgnify:CR=1 FL=1
MDLHQASERLAKIDREGQASQSVLFFILIMCGECKKRDIQLTMENTMTYLADESYDEIITKIEDQQITIELLELKLEQMTYNYLEALGYLEIE